MLDRLIIPNMATTTPFEMLANLDFKYFAKNGNRLNEGFSEALQPYYDQYVKNGHKPFYNLSLAYNSITEDTKFRFLLVTIRGTKVFAPYKVIQILKTRQIRFFGWPTSDNKDDVAESLVYNELKKLPFTRFVFTSTRITNGVTRLVEYDDYFFTLNDKNGLYSSSKYRSKNFINKFLGNEEFRVEFGVRPDHKLFSELAVEWKQGMLERGSHVSTVWDKHFASFLTNYHTEVRYLAVYYRDKPISLQIFLCNTTFAYADCLFIVHKWNDGGDPVLHRFLSCITEIQKYLAWEHLYKHGGIERVYVAGCRPSEHRLLAHKERISDGKIEYFIL